jgi:nicotinamide mononucleotide transporter
MNLKPFQPRSQPYARRLDGATMGGLLATSPLEALAVLSSLVYVALAVPRSRWCWVAGGVGSLIYVWLFARARLPMQSLLQVWYVGVAVFGFLRWSHEGTTRIGAVLNRRPYCFAWST